MTEITHFMVVPFDYVDDAVVAGEPIGCPSPAAAIQRAQGLWKTFGHAGAIALSRTSDFEIGKFAARVHSLGAALVHDTFRIGDENVFHANAEADELVQAGDGRRTGAGAGDLHVADLLADQL